MHQPESPARCLSQPPPCYSPHERLPHSQPQQPARFRSRRPPPEPAPGGGGALPERKRRLAPDRHAGEPARRGALPPRQPARQPDAGRLAVRLSGAGKPAKAAARHAGYHGARGRGRHRGTSLRANAGSGMADSPPARLLRAASPGGGQLQRAGGCVPVRRHAIRRRHPLRRSQLSGWPSRPAVR